AASPAVAPLSRSGNRLARPAPTFVGMQQLPGIDVPNSQGGVAAGRQDAAAVGVDGNGIHRAGVANELVKLFAIRGVPQAHCLIPARGSNARAIADKRHSLNRSRVSFEATHFAAGFHLPKSGDAIRACEEYMLAVRRE